MDKDIKKDYHLETGFFEDGLPYAKIGDQSKILLNIEALSTEHKPPSGFTLQQFKKGAEPFLDDYTVYLIGRKPNLPEGFFMDKMARDYATLIRREFNGPVDVIGVSTGGQIAHFLAADHPDTVRKLVIVSAAFRISERGKEIERKAAEYFQQKKYGKSMAATLEMVYSPGIKRALLQTFIRLFGKLFFRNIKYPNDFLIEVQADREMNFKDRLSEILAPTLIMSGVDDVAYNVVDVRTTANGIPKATLKLYENYGHNLAMSNRKEVLKEALRFLKE
ncbi:MAG: alpha/beta hydrolase [Promethearchaeota archaeon]|nr:MAG: alpha/beta hydrolase [Candidatus Lokiarchaeota archaeon]